MHDQIVDFVAVDPGPEESGIVGVTIFTPYVAGSYRKTIFGPHESWPNRQVLDYFDIYTPSVVLVEGLANYKKQIGNDTIYTGYMVGRVMEHAFMSGIPQGNIGMFLAPEVRANLCGDPKKSKAPDVRKTVIDLWTPELLPEDLRKYSENVHALMALSLTTHYIINVYGRDFFKH